MKIPSKSFNRIFSGLAIPVSLCSLSLLLLCFEPAASEWLRYDRTAIQQGEVWRLLSGNLVHLSWEHLLMNLAGLILIWLLYGRLLANLQWFFVVVISCMAVGAGLYLTNLQLDWYVGQSGMLHGLFVTGVLLNLRQGYRMEWLLLLALIAKLYWEQTQGALPGSAELAGGNVIVDAHLFGAISGLVTGLLFRPRRVSIK